MRIVLPIWLAVMTISLTACTAVFSDKGSQQLRLPKGVGFGISDVLCKDVKDVSIPKRLQELDAPFEWTDEMVNKTKTFTMEIITPILQWLGR